MPSESHEFIPSASDAPSNILGYRPFHTGDRVKWAEVFGEVKQIGLRSTKVHTEKGMLVTIPNSDVLTKLIFNANAGVAESVVSAEMAVPRVNFCHAFQANTAPGIGFVQSHHHN